MKFVANLNTNIFASIYNMRVSFPDFWQPEKYLVYPLDKSYPYAIIWNRWANKKFPYQNRQHSTVVVHPTCNRKVVGSNPTAGLIFCTFANYMSQFAN